MNPIRPSSFGFTLVELLIVIAVIGLLLQMLLPAVEMAREAARRTTCQNHLRQIGLASTQHLDLQKHFPSSGWGWNYVGDADRGYGKEQPGSWEFNLLEYLEQGELRSLGAGQSEAEKKLALERQLRTPLSIFNCPSRRLPRLYPLTAEIGCKQGELVLNIDEAAKSDYAISVGEIGAPAPHDDPPESFRQAADPEFTWYDTSFYTGVSFGRSQVRASQVTDGLTKTYLVGEKQIPAIFYKDGRSSGDNKSLYHGFDNENARSAGDIISQDDRSRDAPTTHLAWSFGGPHPGTWQVVLCDGSVHSVSYDISLEVHQRLANRKDGEIVSIVGGEQ
jgi:prepilin-type N-terminal cleavage/methylation domain-containing protein